MQAIATGAEFASYSARDKKPKAEEQALEAQIGGLNSRQAAKGRPAPDIPAIFSQASEYPTMLIGSVKLTSDPAAEDGLTGEVTTDLTALRSVAGLSCLPPLAARR
ncbi:hypothetical protein LCGC14_2975920 [marine sediment metagenome]|uniref:Uncharacterized protein n=1 Tax=marine sediment metagenome TaxID=412755 RepID=A0A0F8XVF8_9ZZZZ